MNKRNIIVLIVVIIGITACFYVWKYNTPAPFTLDIISRPRSPPGTSENTEAFAGQRCIFLVVVDGKIVPR